MSDLFSVFEGLRRPRILIRAAKIGLASYRRERDLKRLLKVSRIPSPGNGMSGLMAMKEMEATRKVGDSTYSISKHVGIMAALMAEATLLPRPKTV